MMGENSKNNQNHTRQISKHFPTFRNTLAQHKLEAFATFLSVKNQTHMNISQKIQQ